MLFYATDSFLNQVIFLEFSSIPLLVMIQNYRISFNQAQRAINNNSHATTNQESFQIGNQDVQESTQAFSGDKFH